MGIRLENYKQETYYKGQLYKKFKLSDPNLIKYV